MPMRDRIATLVDVAAVVREPVRLGERRLRAPQSIGRYHLRGSGIVVYLRHDVVDDLATLIQVFRQDHYVPPPAAAGLLESLGRPPTALDLGANIGMFGAWFLGRYPGGEVTAYEADPDNARVHGLTTTANATRLRWEVVAAAAGASDGEVSFLSGNATNSRLADAGEAGAVTVPQHDVLARAGDADFLKVDIEGAEWALLDDPRFAELPARVVALEYHAARCPDPDPAAAAVARLERAGFVVAAGDLVASEGHGMVWGWRTA